MNLAIEALREELERAFPDMWSKLRRPKNVAGVYFLDINLDDHMFIVQYSSGKGYGISQDSKVNSFGEGPEEVYKCYSDARLRIFDLLKESKCTCKEDGRCTCKEDVKEHPCPFKVDIANDFEYCRCCDYCTLQCAYKR